MISTRGQLPTGAPVGGGSTDWAAFAQKACPHAPNLPMLVDDSFTSTDPLCQMAKSLMSKASATPSPPPILTDFTPFLGNSNYWKAKCELEKQECPKEAKGFDGLPSRWTMKQTGGTSRLDPQGQEYGAVKSTFLRTFSQTIKGEIVVYRIEHPTRWKRYQDGVEKLDMCKEYWAFHGSSKDSLHSIIQGDGVDPSRIKVGAFGRGAYFALRSSTSHSYARRDQGGEQHMLLCRIAIKEAAIGNSSMSSAPPGCDTTCDSSFTIFCKFDPSHIYESYVISYSV